MSRQPTHHGYAVYVKDHGRYADRYPALSDDDAECVYRMAQERFWEDVQDIAREHGFREVYSDGRSSGYAVPQPQPATDDMSEYEVDAWVTERFRPFEHDVLALMRDAQEEVRAELADANARAAAEPAEAAYWAARDTITV